MSRSSPLPPLFLIESQGAYRHYSPVLRSLLDRGNVSDILSLWETMLARNIRPPLSAYEGVMDALSKANRFEEAMSLHAEMASRGVPKSGDILRSMAVLFANNGPPLLFSTSFSVSFSLLLSPTLIHCSGRSVLLQYLAEEALHTGEFSTSSGGFWTAVFNYLGKRDRLDLVQRYAEKRKPPLLPSLSFPSHALSSSCRR